jgi:outer membrane immunogenic protein
MRHWLCTISAAAILASGSAFAADLGHAPPPAPLPPPVPVFTWAGFYVGAHVGYAWGQENDDLSRYGVPEDSFNVDGVLGGLHAGYNWQINQVVLGVEGDVDASGVRGTDLPASIVGKVSLANDWQSSVRLRAGYALDRTLIYATGGIVFADDKESVTLIVDPSQTQTLTGWTIGGGLEYALTNNWSGRVEVRYTDFGRTNYLLDPMSTTYSFKAGFHETTALVGISYLFR